MRRRSFLVTAGAAVVSPLRKGAGQTSLGTLAWVEAGSLWVRELPDGGKSKVASADGLHAPRLSPSGRWLTYQDHDDKVYVVRSDGQEGASLEGEAAVWVPHEDRLAVTRAVTGDSRVLLIAPGKESKAPAVLAKNGASVVFSPDGQRFVFVREIERVPPKEEYPPVEQLCLGYVAAREREPEVLVTNQEGDVQPYAWTRDGKAILYWSADEYSASAWCDGIDLYSVAAGGGPSNKLGVSTLVHDDMLDVAPEAAGNQLALTRGNFRETWGDHRIATMNLDSGAVHDLTAETVAASCPRWSPDGSSIAYTAGPDADAAYIKSMTGVNIRMMRPDGTVETKVVTPDMRIGIGGGEEAHVFLQQRKVWLADAGGANPPRQLTGDARYRDEEPIWSADGSHILFGRMDYAGHGSLWLMESSGAKAVEVCRLQTPHDWFGYYGYIDWRDGFDWRQ